MKPRLASDTQSSSLSFPNAAITREQHQLILKWHFDQYFRAKDFHGHSMLSQWTTPLVLICHLKTVKQQAEKSISMEILFYSVSLYPESISYGKDGVHQGL